VETIIDRSVLEELRAGLRGVGYVPGEEGYDEARKAMPCQRWEGCLRAGQRTPRSGLRLKRNSPAFARTRA
jgi:hypothetical protein